MSEIYKVKNNKKKLNNTQTNCNNLCDKTKNNNGLITQINDLYSCVYCQKNFSTKYTLGRHISDTCKIKKKNDEEKENIFKN